MEMTKGENRKISSYWLENLNQDKNIELLTQKF